MKYNPDAIVKRLSSIATVGHSQHLSEYYTTTNPSPSHTHILLLNEVYHYQYSMSIHTHTLKNTPSLMHVTALPLCDSVAW